MDKRRIKIATKVLDEVKAEFPETAEFIDDLLEEECLKENVTVEEVLFYMPRSKKLSQRNIFLYCIARF